MTVLTVWAFAGPDTALDAEADLGGLVATGAVTLLDGAVVSWPTNRTTPRSRVLQNIPLVGVVDSGFWGLLFGTVFFVPLLGSLSHTAPDVGAGVLSGVGLDADAIRTLQAMVRPGTSALFVMTPGRDGIGVIDHVRVRKDEQRISFTLTADQDRNLRDVFSGARRPIAR